MRTIRAPRGVRRPAVAAAVTLLTALAGGCGNGEMPDADRQPATITVSATIAPKGVTVSPSRIGAGAITLLASNQTPRSQRLELRSARLPAGGHMLVQDTGPINPGATAFLKADVRAGSYVVSARGSTIATATLGVGPTRSAQDDGPAP
ncbi:MAG TPA: hypothetical protein VGF63_04155 [Solirubrobacteraceae bacterium]